MVRKILQATDPFLRQKAKPVSSVDKKVLSVIKDLKDTLSVQKDPEGVGLAAPQIGKSLKIFYLSHKGHSEIFINPRIISLGKIETEEEDEEEEEKEGKIMEGCLSLPHYYGHLARAKSVKIKYMGEDGTEKTKTITGFLAQIVQHEVDHLEGVLFVDRLFEQKKKLFKLDNNEEWEEVDL